ncbi:ATP-binding cassette domain-containing protein [Streptomyces sp. NPDC050448]|uniref:ATP-binding cassette domain-containing protein n=1 Tax=Streptomyces sp. NPDC050448 TaxID=3155404 RepID=UPI00342463A6
MNGQDRMSLHFSRCSYRYGRKVQVLDGLDLQIEGRCTVLLGPNGAGKSTLMGVGSSWLTPADGTVVWRRLDPSKRRERTAYRKAVAWLPQSIKPMPGLTVRENVAYIGWLKGMSRSAAWSESAGALDRVKLGKLADRKSHQLSGGQLRRLGIAGALVHQSEIMLLDEPTAGLDPAQRQVLRDLIAGLSEDVHIVVSTHQTEDLGDLYDCVVILEQGQVRYQGDTAGFLSLAAADSPEGKRAEAAYTRLIRQEV